MSTDRQAAPQSLRIAPDGPCGRAAAPIDRPCRGICNLGLQGRAHDGKLDAS